MSRVTFGGRRVAKGALACVVLVFIGFFLLQIDDELVPEAEQWIRLAQQPAADDEEAYLFLLGIHAPADADPIDVGRAEAQAYLEALAARGVKENPAEYEGYPAEQVLPLPGETLYCRPIADGGCYAAANTDDKVLSQVLSEHRTLIERYRRYLDLRSVHNSLPPGLWEPYPRYRHLMHGNRLNQLRILQQAKRGEQDGARQQLQTDITRLRFHLSEADTLVYKVAVMAMLERDLELLTYLDRVYPNDKAEPLPRVNAAERSFRLPMIREFATAALMYEKLDRDPQFFARLGEETRRGSPGWYVRIWFKPNMTSNVLFRDYYQAYELSKLDPEAFYAGVEPTHAAQRGGFLYRLRNVAGAVLNSVATPDFHDHVARVHELDCQIARLNLSREDEASELPRYCRMEGDV